MWTVFMDMHSGGGTKVKGYENIYIEAKENDAIKIFKQKFHRDPYNITCDCCGSDYSLIEYKTLEKATASERDLYNMSFEKFCKKRDVLIIRKCKVIKKGKTNGNV